MATLAVTNTFVAGATIVAADMNENFDDIEAFINTTPGVVQEDIVDAVGDILHGDAANSVGKLAVGTNDYVLTADSSVSGVGLAWKAPTTGDITGLTAGTNIDISSATGPVPTIDLAVDAALVTGVDGTGVDVTFHSGTAGDYLLWDSSEEKLIIEGTNAATALDVSDGNVVVGDGTLAVSGTLTVGTDGSGADVTFHSATGSDNFLWDASDEKLVITGTDGQNALEVADGDVSITDALTVSGGITAPITINNETASYTLVAGDAGGIVEMNNGSANNLTIPPNSSVAFATGTQIIIVQQGAGATTIVEGSGVTTRSLDDNAIINGQYVSVALVKRDTDEWYIFGNLTS